MYEEIYKNCRTNCFCCFKHWNLLCVHSISISENPDLSFETISGEEELFEPITLLGVYSKESMYTRFKLNQQGPIYESNLNLLDQIDGVFQVTKNRLENDYRSFMRGKRNLQRTCV